MLPPDRSPRLITAKLFSVRLLDFLKAPLVDPDRKRSTHGDSLFVLDGIRGLAVVIVIASHTTAFGMQGQGSLGVLLFFFLSGFVLTLPYAGEPRRLLKRVELYRFAVCRALRIIPIYLVAVAVITWMLGANLSWFAVNAVFLKGWNHLWSVAEEVRFYLLFPAVIFVAALLPSTFLRVSYLCVLTWLAYRYSYLHQIDMLDGRFVEFYFWIFTGGVLACFLYSWSTLAQVVGRRSSFGRFFCAGALLVIILFFLSSNQMVEQFWRPLIPSIPDGLVLNGWSRPGVWFFLFLVLVYGSTTWPGSWAGKVLQAPLLRHVGLLSYSLYLFHMPVQMALAKFGFSGEGMFVAVFLTSWVIAWFSYVLIEKPFLNMKPRSNFGVDSHSAT